ncbi:MAG: MupA/Atu3671 family FMN-dependent luciferase-like monooxygenase, partial [Ilumatobacteraceae bacterium]
MGDQPLVAQCAEVARRSGLDVVLIATENESVREYAVDEGIDVVRAGAELTAGLDAHPADVLFSIANLRVIGADALRRVTTAINFHDGPLPGYAGLNVTTWAILQGERHHAITWHLMTADVDSGDIVTSESFPISADETAFSLNARCYEAALASFPRIVSQLVSATLATERQPHGERRMFMRHDRPARLLDPAVPAADSARAVRALDLGHRIRNTIGAARLVLGDRVLVVESAHVADDPSGAPIGTVVAIDGGVRVATADGDLMITAVAAADGTPVDLPHLLAQHGIRQGDTVPSPEPALVAAITALEPELARDEPFWLDRLGRTEPALPPGLGQGRARIRQRIEIPTRTDRATVIATVALWLARTTSIDTATFAVTSTEHRTELARLAPLVGEPVAMLHVAPEATFAELVEMGREELRQVDRRRTLLRDAIGRDPLTRERPLTMPVVVDLDVDDPGERFPDRDTSTLRIVVGSDHLELDAVVPDDDPDALDRIAGQLGTLLAAGVGSPDSPVFELPMLGRDELALLEAINRTDLTHDRTMTIDGLFHAQVARTPHAPALSSGDATLSYAEVGAAVTSMRTRLTSAGVGRGDRIGIAVSRSIDMVVSVLATLDLGAAYLPLDPSYPPERLGFMIDDAGIAVLVATGAMAVELRRPDVTVVDPTSPLHHHDTAPALFHDSGDLAYLIYTSGSTGRPKGVMLEHRQVTNFFVAMDHVIDHDPAGVWLAVTSLSFDISVLELLWTLTRGFHVVLKSDHGVAPHAPRVPKARATITRPVTFSLFYFAAGEAAAADGYRLLLDSARFADRNGFEAVWTPERHFHSFGGAYPNPSVTGAALAAITSSVGIRAGSVVLPLHSPLRVAEEWAVVDNLSGGRVGISFAAGWQPNDFVLNPAAYANAKEELPRSIETVQRLWRGETVTMPGHDGAAVDVHTLPRPVQPELPVWLTSAGSPATFERAGMLGVNVLTHLLGQSVDQLADNVERYRSAWRDAGHRGEGRVTLMMHTYLDHDADTAREVAREPMKGYLGTAVGLLRDVASAFPTFAGRGKGTDNLFASLTPAEMDQLLEVAAHRYLSTSGLFGTPDDAAAIVESVSAAGVDEVACLVDFGVPTDAVLASLELLLQAKEQVEGRRCEPPGDGPAESTSGEVDDSVAELVARHGVSHLQCTPSLAAMLAADPADRAALATIGHLMLGGEALPTSLAADLRELLPGRFTNMYGPTETTIWSLTHEIDTVPDGSIPIGAPIANTSIFVLDAHGCRLPVGSLGELHIGGLGVARGYHDRPDLNAQRFVERQGMGRVYATGDVVRIRPSGSVEFAGRSDNQVKIRGHRIEIGEIEAVLDRHPDVVQSVVVVRESGSDTRLVGYVIMHRSGDATSDVLRKHLAESLPEAMVPSVIVALDSFPLTPNGKIDRRALPVATGITG